MVSICIPTHDFPGSEFYLNRCLDSIRSQSYQDYEIIVKRTGKGMAHNLNEAIKEAKGDFIKVLFTDDYFRDKHALKRLIGAHKGNWTVTGCIHDNGKLFNPHFPEWNDRIVVGNNTIGSPSVLLLKNRSDLPVWDVNLSWLTDCDYYQKLYDLYGEPVLVNDLNVVIGIHENQETCVLADEIKSSELEYMKEKYGKN